MSLTTFFCIFCNGADSMKQKLFQFLVCFFFALARQKECDGPKAKCEKKIGGREKNVCVHQTTMFIPGWKHFIAIRLTIDIYSVDEKPFLCKIHFISKVALVFFFDSFFLLVSEKQSWKGFWLCSLWWKCALMWWFFMCQRDDENKNFNAHQPREIPLSINFLCVFFDTNKN